MNKFFTELFKSKIVKIKEAEQAFEEIYNKLYIIQKKLRKRKTQQNQELIHVIADKIVHVFDTFDLLNVEFYHYKNLILATKVLNKFHNTIVNTK